MISNFIAYKKHLESLGKDAVILPANAKPEFDNKKINHSNWICTWY